MRRRRKTVTLDEQCDVVEFDAEEHEEAGYEDMDVDWGEDMQIDELDSDPHHPQDDLFPLKAMRKIA